MIHYLYFMINTQTNETMTTTEINNKLNKRAKELLSIPQVAKEYQSKESESLAKEWILSQALITLMYSPEERAEMIMKKQAA